MSESAAPRDQPANLPASWIQGGGEMGDLISGFDWSRTPIGPAETWSPALRTMVRFLLANRFPLLLWWGPDYICIYNDPYRPVLGKKHPWALGRPVRECWSEIWHILQPLIDDMIETMRSTNGVGLAAPQVGVLRRIVVIEEPTEVEELEDGTEREIAPAKLYVMINPEIVKASEETTTMLEGCLSLPGRYGEVPRPSWVTLKYYDLQGKEQRIRRAASDGYKVGRIAQHEIDHLDGVLFTERIADMSTLVDYRQDQTRQRPRRRGFLRRKPAPDAQPEGEEK